MPELRDAIPTDVFKPMFKNVSEKIIAKSVPDFIKNKPKQVTLISLFIWDEMVHRGIIPDADKYKIAPIIHNEFKGIYEFVKHELGLVASDGISASKLPL